MVIEAHETQDLRGNGVAYDHVARMFDTIGTDQLEAATLDFINSGCQIDHFTVYRIRRSEREFLGGGTTRGPHGRSGPSDREQTDQALHEMVERRRRSHGLICGLADPAKIDSLIAKERFLGHRVAGRWIACDQRGDEIFALSLLRFQDTGPFTKEDFEFVTEAPAVVISAFAKHSTLYRGGGVAKEFSSIATIEERLRPSQPRLSPREMQVAARIIYGISSHGIAVDLGIGEESVATYRKRAYHRLNISSQYELLQFYLRML